MFLELLQETKRVNEADFGKMVAGAAIGAAHISSPITIQAKTLVPYHEILNTEADVNLLTKYNFAEGANQSEDVWIADTYAVLNRMKTGKYGSTISAVVRNMSSAIDTNSAQWQKANNPALRNEYENQVFNSIHLAVERALSGEAPNPIGNATHFENVGAFGEPTWAAGATVVATIGDHTYYEGVQ